MLRYVLAAAAAFALPAQATAQILTNGGFESDVVSGTCCTTVPPSTLTGWTATPNVNVVNGTFSSSPYPTNLAIEGRQYLDLIGEGTTGSISQTFNTVIGQAYALSFAYSHNLFGGSPSASGSYAITNSGGFGGTVVHTGGTNSNLAWINFTGYFTATAANSTLTFTNLTGQSNAGLLLDRISISAVPEPEIWAMMLLGFGAIGFQMRRRSGLRTVTA